MLVFGALDKWTPEWSALHSKIVEAYLDIKDSGRVLCSIWQDSNKAGLFSAIYNGTEWVAQNHKKPKATSTQAAITKQPFASI